MAGRIWWLGTRAVGVAVALSACLPEGGPGIGQRWVEGRGIAALAVPSSATASKSVVYARRVVDPPGVDNPFSQQSFEVYALDQPQAEPTRLMARAVSLGFGFFAWDARDRLWLLQPGSNADRGSSSLLRVDLASKSVVPVGEADQIEVGPDGQTIVVRRRGAQSEAHDLQDHVQNLGVGVGSIAFLGPSLFFTSPAGLHQLALPAAQPPRLLQGHVRSFWSVPNHQAEQLLLVDVGEPVVGDPLPLRRIGLLRGIDPTPALAVLAEGHFLAPPVLSEPGDRVALLDRTAMPEEVRVRVVELASGRETAATFSVPPLSPPLDRPAPSRSGFLTAVFRPGSGDLWILSGDALVAIFSQGMIRVVENPGRRATVFAGPESSRFSPLLFTSDGRFWVFREADGRLQIGDANDPNAQGALALTEAGRTVSSLLGEINGGRGLLYLVDQGRGRSDLRLADLAAQRIVVLARDVGAIVPGGQRLVAIVDKLEGEAAPGQLISIDLASGASTHLADNVVDFRLAPVCATCDPTGPGVDLQYLVQARFPFKHDGLWRATLP